MEVIQRDEPPTKKAKTIHDTGGDGSARPFVASRGNSIPYIDLTQDNIAQREPPVTETQITTNCDAVPTRAFSPDVSNTRVADPATAYDTCFGLLCVQATCSDAAKIPSQCTPVTLGFEGKVIRIYLRESNERVAIILSDALAHLVEKFAVTLTGTICGKKLRSMAIKKVEKLNPMTNIGVAFCSLRIVVYGNLMHGSTVAEILGKNDLFLQHPGKTEFDNSVNYLNPQYLLPPDEGMPPIEKLSVSHCCAGRLQSATSNTFWEDERANIYRVFDTAGAPNGTITTIEPSSRLLSKPKRHQMEALVMMIEKEAGIYDRAQFPTMWKASHTPSEEIRYQNIVTGLFEMSCPLPVGGGILADEMGLGKTLSSLCLICHSLDLVQGCPDKMEGLPRATLIVTPKSTIYGWEKQIKSHIKPASIRWTTYHGPNRSELGSSIDTNDIVLTTYDTLRSDELQKGLLAKQEWARIILDEAHRIRNRSSKIFQAVCKIRARCRWCLTGTPIQNSLDDFGSLLAFIKVYPLESKRSFDSHIAQPIIKKRKDGFQMLRKVVAATCLRRTKENLASSLCLPLKTERVERIEMDRHDRQLYEFFKRFSYLAAGVGDSSKRKADINILPLISMLRLICDHGEALLTQSALKAWRDQDGMSLTKEVLESGIRRCISCHCDIEELHIMELVVEELRCGHSFCTSCVTKSQNDTGQLQCPHCGTNSEKSPSFQSRSHSPEMWTESTKNPLKPRNSPSAKVEALLRNIRDKHTSFGSGAQPAKAVIFSQWTKMLDLVGDAFRANGLKFQRIDGQLSLHQRKAALESFGNDLECNIMLASIGAAGEGIDLTAANSVHIMEPHWNPMAEAQAIDRVHRFGQLREVEVVRYIVNESIEHYVQEIQRQKLRVIKNTLSPSEERSEKINTERWKILCQYLD